MAGRSIAGRIYSISRAMWRLSWFLRDFDYDTELLGRQEIEDKALIGLSGVVKATHTVVHGIRMLNLDGFGTASQWGSLPRQHTYVLRGKSPLGLAKVFNRVNK